MRRALLLAILAAPGAAAAQTVPQAGKISFADGNDQVRGMYINADECAAASATAVSLTWTLSPVTAGATLPAGYTIEVWASNMVQTNDKGCNTANVDSSGYKVQQVASTSGVIDATALTQTESYPTSSFPGAAIGIPCSTAADTIIYVCVQAVSAGTVFGFAKSNMTLSISKPGKPLGVGASSDDRALQLSWSEPANGYDYLVTLKSALDPPTDMTTDPNDPSVHTYRTGAHVTRYRAGGLVNGVHYDVKVAAFTIAGTQGDPQDEPVVGTPAPVNDYFEEYRRVGGQEVGGCGAGAAGPAALLAVAALLAALRRRA